MTQFPIIDGIYADTTPQFRTALPVNYMPVPKQTGIANGFMRPSDGITLWSRTSAIDRGGINWNGVLYRVIGNILSRIDLNGNQTAIGDVGFGGLVTFAYSFTDLAIVSNGDMFLYNETDGLRQNTDPDLGQARDIIWIDGYFMTTDGEFLVVTELNAPLSVNPLKYGSSEVDPDPVVALLKVRNEAAAINRYTIEFFDNIGGDLFPFQRIEGAQVQKGALGTHCCCIYQEAVAFLGGGFNEQPSIYVGANSTAQKIATQEIDTILREYTEDQLSQVLVEARNDNAHWLLYIHLPDRTLVYDAAASQAISQPVWFVLTSATEGYAQYRGRSFVWVYDKWICGDPTSHALGYLTNENSYHYTAKVRWEFATQLVYNEGRGALFNELELVALTGSVAFGANPYISTSYTLDGVTWSMDNAIQIGVTGQRTKRLVWFRQGHMKNWRAQRFRGDSDAHMAVARLEGRLTPLAW